MNLPIFIFGVYFKKIAFLCNFKHIIKISTDPTTKINRLVWLQLHSDKIIFGECGFEDFFRAAFFGRHKLMESQ